MANDEKQDCPAPSPASPELLLRVLQDCPKPLLCFLSLQDLVRSSRTSKVWKIAVYQPELWDTIRFSFGVTANVIVSVLSVHGEHTRVIECKFNPKLAPALSVIAALPRLQNLNLEGSGQSVDDNAIRPLSRCKSLARLHVGGFSRLSQNGVLLAASCPTLRFIALDSVNSVSDAVLARLAGTNISAFHLDQCSSLTEKGLEAFFLAVRERLLDLHLGYSKLSDRSMEKLADCRLLEELSLYGCGDLSDNGFALLARLPALARLDLSQCTKLTDAGLKALVTRNSLLTHLNLYNCSRVTSEGIRVLAQCAKLQCLELFGLDNVTADAVSEVLSAVRGLTRVDVGGCRNISPRELKELRTMFPHVKI
jgi:F-box/leucine-rich repeat protein 14